MVEQFRTFPPRANRGRVSRIFVCQTLRCQPRADSDSCSEAIDPNKGKKGPRIVRIAETDAANHDFGSCVRWTIMRSFPVARQHALGRLKSEATVSV